MAVKKVTTKKEKPVKKAVKVTKSVKTTKPKTGKVVKDVKDVKIAKEVHKEKVVEAVAVQEIKKENVEKVVKKTNEKYFYAVGRRKSAVAQIRLFEDNKATDNDLIINGKKFKEYFPTASLQNNLLSPLKAVGMQGNVRMTVVVRGGGTTGQVEAVRLGIARALVEYDEKLKKTLKDLGLLTRDSRKVERKKPGLKKARKAPQWAKR